MLAGTWQGTSVNDIQIADIFPWDRSSVSFDQPIIIKEYGIHAMLSDGNFVYVLAGISGNLYKSNGYDAVIIAQIPNYVCNLDNNYLETYPGALIKHKERIMFGIGNVSTLDGMGVYSIEETAKGTILTCEHTISTGSTGSGGIVKVGALLSLTRNEMLVGWRDASSYGIDKTDLTTYGSGYFETQLDATGTTLNKKQFSELEFFLAKLLQTGESVTVDYRNSLDGTWTTIGAYAFSDLGDRKSTRLNSSHIPLSRMPSSA